MFPQITIIKWISGIFWIRNKTLATWKSFQLSALITIVFCTERCCIEWNPVVSLYICNEHHHHFFLDNVITLVHVNSIRQCAPYCARGREHEGSWERLWQSQKSPWWKGLRWKLLIIQFLLATPNLSCKFNSALPLNYISERCFGAISFRQENLVSQKTISHN